MPHSQPTIELQIAAAPGSGCGPHVVPPLPEADAMLVKLIEQLLELGPVRDQAVKAEVAARQATARAEAAIQLRLQKLDERLRELGTAGQIVWMRDNSVATITRGRGEQGASLQVYAADASSLGDFYGDDK